MKFRNDFATAVDVKDHAIELTFLDKMGVDFPMAFHDWWVSSGAEEFAFWVEDLKEDYKDWVELDGRKRIVKNTGDYDPDLTFDAVIRAAEKT